MNRDPPKGIPFFNFKPTVMNKIFITLLLCSFLFACTSGEDKAKVDSMATNSSDSTKKEAVNYPYTIDYSSNFEIGDNRQAKTILDIWKDWDDGNLSNSKAHFADSVEMHFADGNIMHTTVDSVMAQSQKYRDQFSKVVSSISAVIPLRSTDKNENWVAVWGTERDTHKDGKVDSFHLQEVWRFNKDNKVNLLYQYMAKSTPPGKK